ncbi:hypothetical protein [Schleiferilactobacillus shenzhenensis]|nr:hypothetical protein [Schleiferilactobacillus shenzhenensis]
MANFWCKRWLRQRWWLFLAIATAILTSLIFWHDQEAATQYVYQQEVGTNSALANLSQTGSRYLNQDRKVIPQYRPEVALLDQIESSLSSVYTALDATTGQQYMAATIQSSQAAGQYQSRAKEWPLQESQSNLNQRVNYYHVLLKHGQILSPPDLTTGFPNGLLPLLHGLLTGWVGAVLIFIGGLIYSLARQAKDRSLIRLAAPRMIDVLRMERQEYAAYVIVEIVTVLAVTMTLTLVSGTKVFADGTLSWQCLVDRAGATVLSTVGWPILIFVVAATAQARLAQAGALLFNVPVAQVVCAVIVPIVFGWQTHSFAVVMTSRTAVPIILLAAIAWGTGFSVTAVWLRKRG